MLGLYVVQEDVICGVLDIYKLYFIFKIYM